MSTKRSKSLSPEPSGSKEYKRTKVEKDEEDCNVNSGSSKGNLLDFSDDVLLHIMEYLYPQDLMALSLCCKRLDRVCHDRTLWRIIDCRHATLATQDLDKYIKFLQHSTTQIAVRGDLETKTEFGLDFLKKVNKVCSNLKELIIEDCRINTQEIQICSFPERIEKFSLKGCDLYNITSNRTYLFKINIHMESLTCLILSRCAWVTSHSLLVLSKIPNLKELRLDSCEGLSECVAYASLATRFGFRTLEILDLRDTLLGDSEICCFSSTVTLTHIYLECPSKLIRRRIRRHNRIHEGDHNNFDGEPVYEDPNLVQYVVEDELQFDDLERCLISDRAVCALGPSSGNRRVIFHPVRDAVEYQQDGLFEEAGWISMHPNLKTLVVRNYSRVTNQSLVYLAVNANSLELLDVTGTAVTKEGILTFKNARPNVTIISSFNEE
ncbi:uncharacterized protein [Venturia canescens]|nr:uncharacterized protein LOC122416945 isoform X2 [Venturia canescens]XP_043286048.1 uncharacterized protein LOC122416945 isoform X2 [Venturia canescens]